MKNHVCLGFIFSLIIFFLPVHYLFAQDRPENSIKRINHENLVAGTNSSNFHGYSTEEPFSEPRILFPGENVLRFDTVFILSNIDSALRQTYIYNSHGRILQMVRFRFMDGSWVNFARETYEYDSVWNVTSFLFESWGTGAWESVWRSTDTYDQGGNRVSKLWEDWLDGSWDQSWRATDTYDFHGNLVGELMENRIGGVWTNVWRDTYSYDSNNDRLTYLWENWTNGSWENSEKASYIYDVARKNISQTWEAWLSGTWSNSWKYSFLYNAEGKVVNELWESWINEGWSNYRQYNSSYDINGNRLSLIGESWNTSAWINYDKNETSYNSGGKAVTGDYYQWDGQSWVQDMDGNVFMGNDDEQSPIIFIGYHVSAHYISFADLWEGNKDETVMFTCFPNPVSAETSIHVDLNGEKNVTIILFDNKGNNVREIFSGSLEKGGYFFNVSFQQFPDGIYYAKCFLNKSSKTIKIIHSGR